MHGERKQGLIISTVMENNFAKKRHLETPYLRWKDCAARGVGAVEPGTQWREVTENKDRWRDICLEDL